MFTKFSSVLGDITTIAEPLIISMNHYGLIFGFLYGYPKIFACEIANLLTHAPQIMYLFYETLKAPLTRC